MHIQVHTHTHTHTHTRTHTHTHTLPHRTNLDSYLTPYIRIQPHPPPHVPTAYPPHSHAGGEQFGVHDQMWTQQIPATNAQYPQTRLVATANDAIIILLPLS